MTDENFYYAAPAQEVFEDVKKCATEIWQSYDNTYGYVDEKVSRIKNIENIRDNCAYIVAMFDIHNQSKLYEKLKSPAKLWLLKLLSLEQEYYEKSIKENQGAENPV